MSVGSNDFLNVRETARLLNVHENTIRNWVKEGTLPDARVPGSRFHRFRQVDVERLIGQRGRTAATLKQERQTIGPELVDGTQLNLWADTRSAQDQFPELMRRLLVATPGLTSIFVRANDGVSQHGWDGTVDSDGAAFLPAGRLRFEFSVDKKPKGKADSDWSHRIQSDQSPDVFIYATPRRWGGAQAWATARQSEHKFADVKVIDADVLEGWLQVTPSVHYWISEVLGRRPLHAQTIERWWERFSARTNPTLPEDFFMSGRSEQATRLKKFLEQPAAVITIQSEWDEDTKAFIHAATRIDKADGDEPSPIILVDSPEVWERILEQPGGAILIPTFKNADVASALSHGHHVLLVIDLSTISGRGADLVLPRLDRHVAAESLQRVGIDFTDAQRHAAHARRNLPAFTRSLSRDPRLSKPSWAEPPLARILAPLILAGSWTTEKGDIQTLEQLVGKPWTEIADAVTRVSGTSDPVFRKVGNQWNLTSPIEVFLLLGNSLEVEDIERFAISVRACILEQDPALDLSVEEQPLAGLRGLRREHSHALREGLARGTALLGAFGDDIHLDDGRSLAEATATVVRSLLDEVNQDATGRRWQELADVLPLLAEAAPQEFLNAVGEDLNRAAPTLKTMFQDSQSGAAFTLGPSSPHPHLLWALETLCWSQDYLLDGVRALAKLAEIDPGGKTSNRPIESLATILCGWSRGTSASLKERIDSLQIVRESHPDVCWTLLLKLWPSDQGFQVPPASPHIRDWRPSTSSIPMADWVSFTHAVVQHGIELAGQNPDRIAKLADGLANVSATDQEGILQFLENLVGPNAMLDSADRLVLWTALHNLLLRHQRFATARWAYTPDVMSRMSEVVNAIEPTNHPQRFAYLFDWHPDLQGVSELDLAAYDEKLHRLQSEAIGSLLIRPDAVQALTQLTQAARVPQHVGWLMAESDELSVTDLLSWFESSDAQLRDAATSWAQRKITLVGGPWLKEALALAGVTGQARELVIRSVPAQSELWPILEVNPVDADTYWKNTFIRFVALNDVEQAVTQLSEHGRVWAAVQVLADAVHTIKNANGASQNPLTEKFVVDILDRALQEEPRPQDISNMTSYYLGELLDYLESIGTSASVNARYEFAFFRLLDHNREPKALNVLLASDHEVFVDLVKQTYRGTDEDRSESTETQRQLVTQAWWVLHEWRGFPGGQQNGTVDQVVMRDWVVAARLAFSEAKRSDIGDELIGHSFAHSPSGVDGVWPAEPVRDLIEAIGSRELENGFVLGRLNSRGVTTRGPYDGGRLEREEMSRYKAWSQEVKSKWPRTSRILREIAEQYERDAHRNDVRAELDADRD